jgi:hypothetical protein
MQYNTKSSIADAQIFEPGVSYVPETDPCSMEVRDNLRPGAVAQLFALSATSYFIHATSAGALTPALTQSLF